MVSESHSLPRALVAAPASGHGKTTIAVGVMAALSRRGLTVAPSKVGPDYIDPGYHALATGRPSRTLDPFLVGESRVAPLLLRGALHPRAADVAILEGVMGLLDGQLGGEGFASSAHVARLTRTPVLLVVDISATSRTVAATVHGLATIDPEVQIAGVVLNKAGTQRHGDEARRAVEAVGVPVWGVLPRDAQMQVPSRHLGLVPAAERDEAASTLAHIADRAEEHIDLDAVLAAAQAAPRLDGPAWSPSLALREVDSSLGHDEEGASSSRPVVAVSGGRAFTFRYVETVELLTAAGCQVVEVDPARDRALPAGTAGLYLGGGFPEMHTRTLATNHELIGQIRAAINAGMPTIAECAGMLYLAETLEGHPMVGAVPTQVAMDSRLTLGYREAVSTTESVLGPPGQAVRGHEFHRTSSTPATGTTPAWQIHGQGEGFALDPAGTGRATLVASYLHTHWAGSPSLAAAFARSLQNVAGYSSSSQPQHEVRPVQRDVASHTSDEGGGLGHHGDDELSDDLIDLAVNVRLAQPPRWLTAALRDELATIARYPDATRARDALAARHGRARDQVLPTSGAAEAFTLIAQALTPTDAVLLHPQFTEPEVALRAAGHPVRHVLLRPEQDFALTDDALTEIDDADLVVIGNPTNPTGRLHPAQQVRSLARPGRVLVVDEAFMDLVPGEAESLLDHQLTDTLIVRSLTKTWGVAGIRAGYVVGEAALIAALAQQQPHWSVGSLALRVMTETSTPQALREANLAAQEITAWRAHLIRGLTALGVPVTGTVAPFVLAQLGVGVRELLRERGWAVRRGDTFPGLDPSWVRIAVRDPHTIDGFLRALTQINSTQDTARSA